MKPLLLFLCAVSMTAACYADDISFTRPAWDSLAIPLGIPAFYLKIESPQKARSVTLEMDLYAHGKFVRTLTGIGVASPKAQPLKANFAIYFDAKGGDTYHGTISAEAFGNAGYGAFPLPVAELPLVEGGSASGPITGKLAVPGRSPVFIILAGSNSTKFFNKPEDTLAANPKCFAIVGYLKTE